MLTSMRRSTFADKGALSAFLLQLMDGSYAVLAQQQHLGNAECFHQFCRLLGRLKMPVQVPRNT